MNDFMLKHRLHMKPTKQVTIRVPSNRPPFILINLYAEKSGWQQKVTYNISFFELATTIIPQFPTKAFTVIVSISHLPFD